MRTLRKVKGKGKGNAKRPSGTALLRLRTKLKGRYPVIAERADVSWFTVWSVLHGRKTSARVLAIASAVADERVKVPA